MRRELDHPDVTVRQGFDNLVDGSHRTNRIELSTDYQHRALDSGEAVGISIAFHHV